MYRRSLVLRLWVRSEFNLEVQHRTHTTKAPPNKCMQPRTRQATNLHAQICRLSGARLMLVVRRHFE